MKLTMQELAQTVEKAGVSVSMKSHQLIIREHRRVPLKVQLVLLASRELLWHYLDQGTEGVIHARAVINILESDYGLLAFIDDFNDTRFTHGNGDDRMREIIDEHLGSPFKPMTAIESETPVFWKTLTGRVARMIRGDNRPLIEIPRP